MATIELNDDTLYTSALPAGARLFGAQSAAATEPTSFGREAIYNYVSAALAPVASSGSATDLTSGTLPLGRLHAWLADISSIASPATNDVLYFNGTDFVSGPITGLVSAFDDALEAAQDAADAAETSATAAAASASAASTSASNASTSASNASTSASNASTSATNASNSASAASTSATNAASSATTAVAAAGFTHTYSTTTTMADPGPGGVRFNSLTLASITAAAIDDLSATGQDISSRVTSWADSTNTADKGRLLFRKGSTFWAEFKVTGLTDNSGWTELALDYVGHEGTLSNADELVSSFSPTGDEGASGGGTGDVTAASSFGTDNRLVRSDGAGKGVQASGITVDDSDVVSGVTRITASHATGYAGRFVNTQDAASLLEVARFEGDRATPTDGDSMQVGFYLSNDAGTQIEAARMTWTLSDVTASTEDSALLWMLYTGGSPEYFLRLEPTTLSPASNNLIALGSTSVGWADLHLATGGVINWANGEVTLTETDANTLTLVGATLVLPDAGLQIGTSNPFSDAAGTLTLQNIDALDATTEATIESAIDTLANLTSIQSRTFTLADAGANAFFGWDDTAGAYENLTAAEALAIILTVDGTGSGLDADLLDGKNTGTSGNVIPLLDGTNTWSGVQTFGNVGIVVGASTPFSDSAGTLTLQNVDALDATTEATIEAAIDTLANLGSIQGVAFTFGAYAATLLNNANEAAFKAAVNLEANTDFYAPSGTDVAVADGGTGRSTGTTAYALIATGTTATGAQQTLAAGATTEILVGGGASALPVWTTAQGSGAPVRATSPTLTTPVLGAATGTSLATTSFLVAGHTTTVATVAGSGGAATPLVESHATDGTSAVGAYRWSNDTAGPRVILSKSRGGIAAYTVVANGDVLGEIVWAGADGTDFEPGAAIRAEVNATPGAGDMPAKIVFSTTSDGAEAVTDRATIDHNGIYYGSALTKLVGTETIWIPAAAMTARTTNGAAAGTTELATNDVMLATLDFDTTTEEGAGFMIAMPKSWNEGTVTFSAHWTAASGSGGVVWGLAAYAFSDDDAMDTAVSGQQTSTDTLLTANDNHKSPTSSAITIGGSPAAEDMVYFEVTREVANGSDTLGVDAKLIGIKLYFTTDASTDA